MILIDKCLCLFVPVNPLPIQCDAWSVLRKGKSNSEGSPPFIVQCVHSIPHVLRSLLPSTVPGTASSRSGMGRETAENFFVLLFFFILVETFCVLLLL